MYFNFTLDVDNDCLLVKNILDSIAQAEKYDLHNLTLVGPQLNLEDISYNYVIVGETYG